MQLKNYSSVKYHVRSATCTKLCTGMALYATFVPRKAIVTFSLDYVTPKSPKVLSLYDIWTPKHPKNAVVNQFSYQLLANGLQSRLATLQSRSRPNFLSVVTIYVRELIIAKTANKTIHKP